MNVLTQPHTPTTAKRSVNAQSPAQTSGQRNITYYSNIGAGSTPTSRRGSMTDYNNNNNNNHNNSNNNNDFILSGSRKHDDDKISKVDANLIDEKLINQRITKQTIPEILKLHSQLSSSSSSSSSSAVAEDKDKDKDIKYPLLPSTPTANSFPLLLMSLCNGAVFSILKKLNIVDADERGTLFNMSAQGKYRFHRGSNTNGGHSPIRHKTRINALFQDSLGSRSANSKNNKNNNSNNKSNNANNRKINKDEKLFFISHIVKQVSIIVSLKQLKDKVNAFRLKVANDALFEKEKERLITSKLTAIEMANRRREKVVDEKVVNAPKLVANMRTLRIISEVRSAIIHNIMKEQRICRHKLIMRKVFGLKIWRFWRRYKLHEKLVLFENFVKKLVFDKKCETYNDEADFRIKASRRSVHENEQLSDAILKYFQNKERMKKLDYDPEINTFNNGKFINRNPLLKEMQVTYFQPDTADYSSSSTLGIYRSGNGCDYDANDREYSVLGLRLGSGPDSGINTSKSENNNKNNNQNKKGPSNDDMNKSSADKKDKKDKKDSKDSKKSKKMMKKKIVIDSFANGPLQRPLFDDPAVRSNYSAHLQDFIDNSPILSLFNNNNLPAVSSSSSRSGGGGGSSSSSSSSSYATCARGSGSKESKEVDWYELATNVKADAYHSSGGGATNTNTTTSTSAGTCTVSPSNIEKVMDMWAQMDESHLKSMLDCRGYRNSSSSSSSGSSSGDTAPLLSFSFR